MTAVLYIVDFGGFSFNSFLQEFKKEFLYITAKESNYKKYASEHTELLVKLKFDMCIVDHRSSHYINFGVSRRYSSFTGYTKRHTLRAIGSKYLFHFSIFKSLESVQN